MPASKWLYAGILAAGVAATVLLSPKWVTPIFAWIAPGCLLFYFRHAAMRFKTLLFILALLTAQMVSVYNVFPFPWPVLGVLIPINIAKLMVIFLLDKWITKRSNGFIATLVFPAAFVTKEFIDSTFNGGTWWSMANTQYSFAWLAQLSSVTGLAGISFLIYWFASVAVWTIGRYYSNENYRRGIITYACFFTAIMVFGATRFYGDTNNTKSTVKVAGVSVPTINMLEAVYKDVTSQTVNINLKTSIVSKELQLVNSAMLPFIENPDSTRFVNGYKAMYKLHDSLFAASKKAADGGAKIIMWSEANAIMPRAMHDAFIKRGQNFAKANNVYLLMTMGVFDTGKLTADKLFLENKAVFIAPDGRILNVFHKNHPVPYAERSKPGDGKIPVIATPYGKLSVSICYDADMPGSMRQLGSQQSDVLFLPSGDWYAIAPYHTYMAAFRGIENGCTVVRQASGGLSLVTDYRGREQASFDFYNPGEKLWSANIITGHVNTIYNTIGEAFAYLCMAFSAVSIIYLIAGLFFKWKLSIGKRNGKLEPAL